jgi:hypothetical protein
MGLKDNSHGKFEWTVSVSIFRNSKILGQLTIAIGIPFGLLCIFLIFSNRGENRIYSMYALGMVATLFILTYLLIQVLYGGKYDVGFVIDDKGILCYTKSHQAKINRIVNGLTVVLGLLTGKPSAAGAGILAATKQSTFLNWKKIKKVKYSPKQHVIMIRGGFTESMAVFCTEENYPTVKAIFIAKIKT